MIYKEFKDGIKLSRLGMGIMRLPEKNEPGNPIDYEKAKEIIDENIRLGVNYFDTAYIYHNGKSEEFAGKALADYPRDSYYIADKFNFQAQPNYKIQFQEQLDRLNMDYIDFYLLHGIQDNFISEILASGCIEYFDQLKKEGKIRYLGFSFHGNEENMKKMLAAYAWDFVQIQLNYYDWEYGNQRRLYEMLTEAQIPVMVMEPVHGGLLARLNEKANILLKEADPNASLASWAMRWIMSLDNVQVVLSGMGNLDQVIDNAKTFSEEKYVSDEEKALLKKAASLLRPDIAVPCTGCRYCCPNCPQKLDIPTLLTAYNDAKADAAWRLVNITGLPQEKQPFNCIACGACTKHCPQALPIPETMAEMAKIMSNL